MPGISPYPPSTSGSSGGSSGSVSKTGTVNFTADGLQDTFAIPHGMGSMPSYANTVAKNDNAIGNYSVVWDATNITIMYSVAPTNGTITLTWIVVP